MTFLKKLGDIVLKGAQLALGFAPLIQATIPQAGGAVMVLTDALTKIMEVITHAEAFGQLQGLSGPDKAKAAGPLVAQILLDVAHTKGWKIADEAKLQAAAITIGGGVADFLNSIHEDSATSIKVS